MVCPDYYFNRIAAFAVYRDNTPIGEWRVLKPAISKRHSSERIFIRRRGHIQCRGPTAGGQNEDMPMLRKILACTTLMPMLLACAPFAQADIQSMSPEQISLVDSTCMQVMGLRKGEYYFFQCRDSLAQSLAAKTDGQDMAAAYRDCRQRGLAEGTAAFSTCMLDSPARASRPQSMAVADATIPGVVAGHSFYHMPPRERFQHERYSCAQLGLLPGTGTFGECVTSLEGAMTANPD
jgi:hypothetical protein